MRDGGGSHLSERERTRQLSEEIAALRAELGALVGELDRRRRELLDVRLQLKRHSATVAAAGAVAAGLVVGAIWMTVRRSRRGASAPSRAGRLREAVAGMDERSERAAAAPGFPSRILAAAATAAAATTTKKLLARGLGHILDRPGRPAAEGARQPDPSPPGR